MFNGLWCSQLPVGHSVYVFLCLKMILNYLQADLTRNALLINLGLDGVESLFVLPNKGIS